MSAAVQPITEPLAPSPTAEDLAGSRLRRAFNAGLQMTLDTIQGREAWERYQPRNTTLPPTFPRREDRPASAELPAALRDMAYSTRYDIHYDGDFTIPGERGAVVRFSDVMARPDWPAFIRDNLSVGSSQPGDPLRIMVPGLNTPTGESVRRAPIVAHDVDVAIATLANGSTDGIADAVITLPGGRRIELGTRAREWIQAVMQRIDVRFTPRPELLDDVPRDAQGRVEVPPRSGQWLDPTEMRDLRSILNEMSDPNKVLIDNAQRLIMAHIDRPEAPPLELWGYSEGSLVLGKAFEDLEARYLSERMRGVPPQERTQRLGALRERFRRGLDRITVLCIGSAYPEFQTPVRRIDYYAAHSADQVARFAGSPRLTPSYRFFHDLVTPPRRPDALIPYQQPFGGLDAHNLFAAGGSALGLYLEMNGTRTMQGLYDRYRAGTLVHPTRDEVIARIRLYGREREVWDPKNVLPPAN